MERKKSIVFAGAPYSNSAPLVEYLTAMDERVQVINDHPSALLDDLLSGRADAALIPVAHYFTTPGIEMIEGLGVASLGPVKSVLLKCHRPMSEIATVKRDPASATSNALAGLLLTEHFGHSVEMTDHTSADAEVMIGDRALISPAAACGDIDLSAAWTEMTGLPFVFAVWAIRSDYANRDVVTDIAHRACNKGCENLEQMASRYADQLGQSISFWMAYLGESIHYRLDERDMEGMQRFSRYLKL